METAQEASDTYVVYSFNTKLPGTCLDKTPSPKDKTPKAEHHPLPPKKKKPGSVHTRLTQNQNFLPQLSCAGDGHSNLLPFSCRQPPAGSISSPHSAVSSSFPPRVAPAPKHWLVLRRPKACRLCPGPNLRPEHTGPSLGREEGCRPLRADSRTPYCQIQT